MRPLKNAPQLPPSRNGFRCQEMARSSWTQHAPLVDCSSGMLTILGTILRRDYTSGHRFVSQRRENDAAMAAMGLVIRGGSHGNEVKLGKTFRCSEHSPIDQLTGLDRSSEKEEAGLCSSTQSEVSRDFFQPGHRD